MSSILTNTSAMIALQTLNATNKGLAMTTNEISTGKSVATARDNASIWAIAQTMTTDVDSFKGISDGLATGSAAVAVARTAAETVAGLLKDVKTKIVAAQDPSSDKAKLQTDIDELVLQIGSTVSAAQFNGLNLVDGTNASINVLASLNRDSAGDVSVGTITVDGQDLSSAAGTAATGIFAGSANGTTSANGTSFGSIIDSAGGTDTLTIDAANFGTGTAATGIGAKIRITIGGKSATYTVTENDLDATNGADPNTVIATRVRDAVAALGVTDLTVTAGTGGVLTFTTGTASTVDLNMSGEIFAPGAGALSGLATIDVEADATGALNDIEALLDVAIDAAAALGSSQTRIDTQADFMEKLTDSLKTGIGALVDANMEEASARLQALQVQQQLGIQSLSIANQAPQNVLSLFR